jgi:hypothetical protein
MDRDKFQQARDFIFADIEREIALARDGGGAGNFMCALALLCYTEFMGGAKRGKFQRGEERRNFGSFFADLGVEYASLTRTINVYGVFRCGLAHEYFVKEDCTIFMLGDKQPGLGVVGNRYYFVVEQYFKDFKKAVQALETQLYG